MAIKRDAYKSLIVVWMVQVQFTLPANFSVKNRQISKIGKTVTRVEMRQYHMWFLRKTLKEMGEYEGGTWQIRFSAQVSS